MGADLYIAKLDETRTHGGFEVSQEAVNDGYFRDCYNRYGLFAVVSDNLFANTNKCLSWWETRDREELFDKNGRMTITGAKKWLVELEDIFKQFKALQKI